MRKAIAAASIAVSGLGVLGLATAIAGAQDAPSDDDGGGWVQDALGGLVEDGTITQEQADAVEEALEDARPDQGFGGRFGHPGFALGFGGELSTVAESLGIDEDELRSALEDGRTIAEIAEELGVDVQDVVDDIVAAQRARLDDAVAEGYLTQEDADEILAGAEERASALVNGERPDPEDLPDLRGLPHFRDHRPGDEWRGDGPRHDDDPSSDDASQTSATHRGRGSEFTA